MANNTNGNQFRDEEILVLDQLRDGKSVRNIFPKIGCRLRLAHEENDQLSITTEIIKYDKNLAVVRAITTTMKGNFPGLGMSSVDRDHSIAHPYWNWLRLVQLRDLCDSLGMGLHAFHFFLCFQQSLKIQYSMKDIDKKIFSP